jgi:hypothetical protein
MEAAMKIKVGKQYVDENLNFWIAVAHSSKAGYVICECVRDDEAALVDASDGRSLCGRFRLVCEHRKPIDAWALLENEVVVGLYEDKADAEQWIPQCKGRRVIRLVEDPDA